MRKLIYGINVSLDGVCDHTKMMPDEELHGYFARRLREAGTLVYGRITYQLMVPFWPDVARDQSEPEALNDFARAFDAVPEIVVFSRTLQKAEGKKTRIVRTDLRDEILRLKQEPGKDILVGGVDIPSQLMALDLIDEYHVVVQPIIVGQGRHLAPHPQASLRLTLAGTQTFKSGCVVLRYTRP